jgi:hypothetical protein
MARDKEVTTEAEFLVEKPGTKTGLLPGFFVFSSRHPLSSNARYFWSFASFSSRFLQFVSFSSCFEEGTRISFSSRFVKSSMFCENASTLNRLKKHRNKKITGPPFSKNLLYYAIYLLNKTSISHVKKSV